jgi:GNAT superfamily N-acetyltransferase
MNPDRKITLDTSLQAGDVGSIIHLHGALYAGEHGYDRTFEAYVAAPLAEFVLRGSQRERIWLGREEGRIVGCVAIVAASQRQAQLRWLLVSPAARGCGLGRRLLNAAVDFAREQAYESVILWTVSALAAAAQLYRSAGFQVIERRAARQWGVDVVEECYELRFG